MRTLSKSDFVLATSCPTKLYYKKSGYPANTDTDEFMQLLAEGGYMVGKLAQIIYPGYTITDPETAISETSRLMQNENVCLHEAAFNSNGKIVRVDILNKIGNVLELIEVKAKSWDSATCQWSDKKCLREYDAYLKDLAFQYHVVSEANPTLEVRPYLFLPDKSKRTAIDGLNSLFQIEAREVRHGFKNYIVNFTGDADAIRNDHIMTLVDAKEPVLSLQTMIKFNANHFLSSLNPELRKIETPINIGCRDCEFRHSTESEKSGFYECWKDYGNTPEHILNLTRLGNLNKNLDINEKISKGERSYRNLDAELIKGKFNDRPYFQIKSEKETILPELFDQLNFAYPIHFIDFEVSKMALPYHAGMRPYENVAYQWSCHTLDAKDNLTHCDWINTEEAFPNFEFAISLMNQIKNAGTVLIWSKYENTILKDIYEQMSVYGFEHPELKSWLEDFVMFDKEETTCGFIDQAEIANKYYHHPRAKGKYGIKFILPSVLMENKSEKNKQWLMDLGLYELDESGVTKNPYELLPEIDLPEASKVKDGTGAIRAYQDMMYGFHKNDPAIRALWKESLRQYCKLDTLAMVVIYEYWKSKMKI